jgi:uncharacterized phiE125 gp8 family phage protein
MRIAPGNKQVGLPYPLDRVKEFLRVTGTDQDGVIAKMIAAAADWIEQNTWVALGSRTYTAYMDDFNAAENIIHRYPITAVSSVQYYDTSNVQQTLSADNYWTSLDTDISRIYFDNAPNVYDDRFDAVQVNFTAGYADWRDIPDQYVQLLMLIVSDFYDNRGTGVVGTVTSEVKSRAIKYLAESLSKRVFL